MLTSVLTSENKFENVMCENEIEDVKKVIERVSVYQELFNPVFFHRF